MIRKLFMVAAAAAIPLGAVAVGADAAWASKPPPPASPPLTCKAATTVTFASPGLSYYGSVSSSKTSVTTTSPITYNGSGCSGGGSGPAENITSKSTTKCNKKVPGETSTGATMPSCVPGDYVYDSTNGFASGGVSALQKSLKHLAFTITVNGVPVNFSGKTAAAGADLSCPKDTSGNPEIGFTLSGTVKAKPYTYSTFSLVACLDGDSGPGTTGSFGNDFGTADSGPTPAITIATATLDPSSSTLSIS